MGLTPTSCLAWRAAQSNSSFMEADGKDALLRRFEFEAKAARLKWLPES